MNYIIVTFHCMAFLEIMADLKDINVKAPVGVDISRLLYSII